VLRSALTLARAFTKIPTFSSHAACASSLRVSSSSRVRSSSYSSSTATVVGVSAAGLGGGGVGRGLHKANTDKSTTHQETTIRNVEALPSRSMHPVGAHRHRHPVRWRRPTAIDRTLIPGMFPTVVIVGHLPSKNA
jgi:hypothetical protein